mgnify:CR=1 FL=1
MRNLKASVLIGVVSSIGAVLLQASGFTVALDPILLSLLGITPDEGAIVGPPYVTMLLFAFGIAWASVEISRPSHRIIVAVLSTLLLCTWVLVLALYGTFFSPLLPLVVVACSVFLAAAWRKTRGGQQSARLEQLFGRRLSRSGLNALAETPASAAFPGHMVNATVIVLSVHNHAELMELLPAESYTEITNLYLKTSSDYLVESGGYLDECNGESVRVVFGAPIADSRHATRACRAAIDLAARLDDLNKECDARWQRRLDVRMGIESGDMIAGVFGGGRVGSFSVAGTPVDFSRRLCAASSHYGARILVGPVAHGPAAESLEVRPIEVLKVGSQRRRVDIHEILSPKHGLSPEREKSRDYFWTGVLYFREKKWDKAVDEFMKARIPGIPDQVLDYYLRRIEQLRHQDREPHREAIPAFFHVA